LGLSFQTSLEVKSIHLVDPSIDVINKLKKTIKDSYIPRKEIIKLHYIKGQEVVLEKDSKIIFIAGMGGKEIGKILQHLIPQLTANDRLVISPHRNILELREFLASSPLRLVDETVINEDGQFYQILCLCLNDGLSKISQFGHKIWMGPLGEEYRAHQLKRYEHHQDPLSRKFLAFLTDFSS